MATTYRKISEQIRTTFYKGQPTDDASYSLRYVAELVAQEVAAQARFNSIENSNAGETTYANDTFTSTFTNIAVTTDAVLLQSYVALPQIPAALPNNQEITSVTKYGVSGRNVHIIPMKNKDKFMQDILPFPRGKVLYFIENGRIYFENLTAFAVTAVNITMVGAVSTTGNLLDGVLNVPKSSEKAIIASVLALMLPTKQILQDNQNDSISQ